MYLSAGALGLGSTDRRAASTLAFLLELPLPLRLPQGISGIRQLDLYIASHLAGLIKDLIQSLLGVKQLQFRRRDCSVPCRLTLESNQRLTGLDAFAQFHFHSFNRYRDGMAQTGKPSRHDNTRGADTTTGRSKS